MKSTVSTGLRPHDRLAAAGKRSQVRACAERSATAERSSHSSRSCRRGSAAWSQSRTRPLFAIVQPVDDAGVFKPLKTSRGGVGMRIALRKPLARRLLVRRPAEYVAELLELRAVGEGRD